jgi:DNA-directed RNA polymerase subunit RPC12/RpoP
VRSEMASGNELDKIARHAADAPIWRADTHGMTGQQILKLYKTSAICPRCERLAFRDKGWQARRIARCPRCGWRGRAVTVDEYITGNLYK